KAGIGFVEFPKLADASQMNGTVHNVRHRPAGSLNDFFHMLERPDGFFFDRSRQDGAGLEVEGTLAADIQPAIAEAAGGIRASGGLSVGMFDLAFLTHAAISP